MYKNGCIRFELTDYRPPLTEALHVGDLFRKSTFAALGAIYKYGDIPEKYSGKEAGTLYRSSSHDHAYFLPEPDLTSGEIQYLSLYSPSGFEPVELLALSGINRLWSSSFPEIALEPCTVDPMIESMLFRSARQWISLTPFLLSRHPRIRRSERRSRSQYNDALKRELRRSAVSHLEGLRVGEEVEIEIDWSLRSCLPGRCLKWSEFKRTRFGTDHQAAVRYGHGLKLTFSNPVRGPIAIGYASHMGLGLFIPREVIEEVKDP